MFQHMFSSMNDMLNQIIEQYDNAGTVERQQYHEQMLELKKMSDTFIEQWLEFEEKFADFKDQHAETSSANKEAAMSVQQSIPLSGVSVPCNMADLEITDELASTISKGQGYYKLFMFSQAAEQFQMVIMQSPECNLARLFLGMTYMHLQNWSEAQRHFQLLISLTDFPKWLAMGYNALGCIQAVRMNMAQAEQLFLKAYEVCPSFKDPLNNLKSCQETPKQLSLYFGSTELCCL
jgi:tetratricopeptide (TPR) repeat protein